MRRDAGPRTSPRPRRVRDPLMNTLEAFAQALREGADYFEIDVRFTDDHRLVVLHEPVFKARSKAYPVSELTLREIRRLQPCRRREDSREPVSLAVIPVKEGFTPREFFSQQLRKYL